MANQTTPSPQTDAGISFAAWVADRRTLTPEELADILAQLQPPGSLQGVSEAPAIGRGAPQPIPGTPTTQILPIQQWAGPQGSFSALSPAIIPEDIKPTTAFGSEFQDWVKKRDALTAKEIADLKAQLVKLKKELAIATAPKPQPAVPPALIISRTPYPKWWRTLRTAAISLSTTGTQIVVPTPGRFTLFIATIVLLVSDETNITLAFGVFGNSGSMILGGTDHPSGMVIAMGDSPAPCGKSGFTVTSDGSGVAVGGFVTYYLETET